jgi:ribosome biogenesis SPOUT family RNA methylase Rps3
MRTLAGRDAHVHFTHLSKPSCQSLTATFQTSALDQRGSDLAEATFHEYGVLDLIKDNTGTLERVCLLDPKAEQELSPEDGDGRFQYFLFGVRCS